MAVKRLFIDVETTGLDNVIHGAHQISGYVEIDGVVKESFDFKFVPFDGVAVDEKALVVTKTDFHEMMTRENNEHCVYKQLKNIITTYVVPKNKRDKFIFIGYNANFDKGFINQLWKRNDDDYFFALIWGGAVDIMSIAVDNFADVLHTVANCQLMTMAKLAGITIDESKLHDANYDIEVSRELYYICKGHKTPVVFDTALDCIANDFLNPQEVSKVQTAQEPKSLNKISELDYKMTFGKHSGMQIKQMLEIDPGYIIWLHDGCIKGIQFSNAIVSTAIKNKSNKPKYTPTSYNQKATADDWGTDFDDSDDLPF